MATIFPVSDMHIESYRQQLGKYRGKADIIIAAGDIHTKSVGPAELRRIFGDRKIIYITGNHEYYRSTLGTEDDRLRQECLTHDIHFLQCDSVEIDGTIYVGCTLWTDFQLFGSTLKDEAMAKVGMGLNDYRAISSPASRRAITTKETLELHQQHKTWLTDQFEANRDKRLVVITHHGPSTKCIHPSYTEDLLSAGFASDLDDLVMQSKAIYWICGHSHIASHFKVGDTEVWQNCMGYAHEKIKGFNPRLLLEI